MRRAKWALAAALIAGCQASDPVPLAPSHTQGVLYPGLTGRTASGLQRASHEGVPADAAPAPASEEAIDLGVALRLAGVDNPTINLAMERVRESLADQLAARALLLPHVAVGGNYRAHNGPLQASGSQILDVKLQSLDLGIGTGAIGGGTAVVPGVRLFAHLGDAAYEPLAARQRVIARSTDAVAVRNQILLGVAVAYLELIAAEAQYDILKRAEGEIADIVRIASEFAKAGQGTQSDANRAAANAEFVRRQVSQAEGRVAAASARLCRLLNLDPALRLRTPGGPVEWTRLIDEDADTENLVATATANRPEALTQSAVIQVAMTRVRQEKMRPFLPTLSVGFSAGLMGGGTDADSVTALGGRTDLDVFAVWNVQNLGFGNRARIRVADATVGQAVAAYDATINQVRREVVSAQADAQAACRQLSFARTSLTAAEEGFKLERERVKQGQGRPIETLDSFRQALEARQEFLRAVVAFDIAQFRLFTAVGNAPGGE